jgi:hypothetical protein
MKCKYNDCGWCYAPENVETNATQGGCFEPEYCPYTKQMINQQPPDIIEIGGVKYQRVEEPKPPTLYEALHEVYYGTNYVHKEEICGVVERWLPAEVIEDGEDYNNGWNDCLKLMRDKIK